MVDPVGKITYFNDIFQSLMIDRLLFDCLPTNIFSICRGVRHNVEALNNLFAEALDSKNREDFSNKTIELRIPHTIQPQVSRIYKLDGTTSQDKEQDQAAKEKDSAQVYVYEMIRVSCQVSQKSATKSLILSIQRVSDYQMHAQLICEQSDYLQAFLTSFEKLIE